MAIVNKARHITRYDGSGGDNPRTQSFTLGMI